MRFELGSHAWRPKLRSVWIMMRTRIIELIIVLTVAVGAFACLQQSTWLAETLFINFTFGTILLSLTLAIGMRGAGRVFWIGFLSTSVLYLVFAAVPDENDRSPRLVGPEFTTSISNWALKRVFPELWNEVQEVWGIPVVGGLFSVSDTLVAEQFLPIQDSPEDLNGEQVNPFDSGEDENLSEVVGSWEDISGVGQIKPFPVNLICYAGSDSSRSGHRLMAIAHSVWALLLGWIVGHVAMSVHRRTV